jgi:hypothetical protein
MVVTVILLAMAGLVLGSLIESYLDTKRKELVEWVVQVAKHR